MTTTIGVAIIAHNEETNIARLVPLLKDLKSKDGRAVFDQIVVVTQTNTTDNTAQVARDLGAEVYDDFVWTGDFTKKRTYSFSKLTTRWCAWIDCDDVPVGWDKARDFIEEMEGKNPNVSAVWLSYMYDQHKESGNWIAVHSRERFVRPDDGWHWTGAVHEHMISTNPNPGMAFVQDGSMLVEHHRNTEIDPQRNQRNIDILRRVLKEKPQDARSWFDLGSQYYHGMRWARCIACYTKFLKYHAGPAERYQSLHRMADAWRQLGRPDRALRCEVRAIFGEETIIGGQQVTIEGREDWKDAWYGLAECRVMMGRAQAALQYNAMADPLKFGQYAVEMGMPDPLLVLNPLDYVFHPLLTEHRALASQGKVLEALEMVNKGVQIVGMHPEMKQATDAYTAFIQEHDAVDATLALAKVVPDDDAKERLFLDLPTPLRKQKSIRDALIAPILLKNADADVTIFCGPSLDDWGPSTPEKVGIGGSETAVIEMACRLSDHGLKVAVYNQCAEHEGLSRYIGGDVRYIDYSRYDPTRPTKLFVAWRNPGVPKPPCDQAWWWVHDLNVGPNLRAEHTAPFDLVRPVSQWHGQHLAWLYPFLKGKIAPTRNGVDLARFGWWQSHDDGYWNAPKRSLLERSPHRALWTSSPDRGLEHLLAMWPAIRAAVPDAELRIAYGMDNIDKTIARSGDQGLAQLKSMLQQLSQQPGIEWIGRINQIDLAREFQQSQVLAYSSHYLETNHIGGAESMAGGCVVLSTLAGAIPETTAGAAVLINGHPNSAAYRGVFVRNIVGLMTHPEEADKWRQKGYERAAQLTWGGVADEWVDRIEGRIVGPSLLVPNGAYTGAATTGMVTA